MGENESIKKSFISLELQAFRLSLHSDCLHHNGFLFLRHCFLNKRNNSFACTSIQWSGLSSGIRGLSSITFSTARLPKSKLLRWAYDGAPAGSICFVCVEEKQWKRVWCIPAVFLPLHIGWHWGKWSQGQYDEALCLCYYTWDRWVSYSFSPFSLSLSVFFICSSCVLLP